ncbi:MAG TPA: DUF6468 domain-containing protein [Rhizomicrobium sp.]|jgi:hypothetical protein
MTLSLAAELVLALLLCVTVIYCVRLERRLAALRSGQDGLKSTIAQLNGTIEAAGASMRLLKSAAEEAAEALESRLTRARGLIDELSLVNASGERLAARFEKAISPASARAEPPGSRVLANRLNALKPQSGKPEILRSVR